VTVRVPAKINLQLSVGSTRPDGYHELVTVFQAVSLFDEVTATQGAPGSGVHLTCEGADADRVPCDSSNLAVRAAVLLAERAGVIPDVRLHLTKRIPVAGGMAGGSADAAGALVACDALWGLRTERHQLHELAAVIGADVPFGLVGGTAVGLGTGTQLTAALARGTFQWVLAVADGGLSTAAVFSAFDELAALSIRPEPRLLDDLMSALRSGDAVRLGRSLHNDLQRAALELRPALQFTLDVGEEYGALAAIVSGSGPTVAFLARDETHALDLAAAVTAAGVCRRAVTVDGPVAGAKVLEPPDPRQPDPHR
jgi:4-diphosphocytidyl-2-C-methyl-D-erythritol kinase